MNRIFPFVISSFWHHAHSAEAYFFCFHPSTQRTQDKERGSESMATHVSNVSYMAHVCSGEQV